MTQLPAASHLTHDLDSLETLRFSRPRHMISVQRFMHRFGYDAGALEALSRVPPGLAHSNPFSARVQHYMQAALDVVARHMASSGDLDEAIRWFKSEPLPEHAGRTAEQIVADGEERMLLRSTFKPN